MPLTSGGTAGILSATVASTPLTSGGSSGLYTLVSGNAKSGVLVIDRAKLAAAASAAPVV